MDLSAALTDIDARHDHGEVRTQALGRIGGRLHMLVFTMRGSTVPAISLRKASTRERKRYDKEA